MPTCIAAEICNRCMASGTITALVICRNFMIILVLASGFAYYTGALQG